MAPLRDSLVAALVVGVEALNEIDFGVAGTVDAARVVSAPADDPAAGVGEDGADVADFIAESLCRIPE